MAPEAHPRSIDPPFRWAILTSASRDWPCAELDMLCRQRWTDATSAAIVGVVVVLLRAGRRRKLFFSHSSHLRLFSHWILLLEAQHCVLSHIIPHPLGPCPLGPLPCPPSVLSRNWLWASSRGQGRSFGRFRLMSPEACTGN